VAVEAAAGQRKTRDALAAAEAKMEELRELAQLKDAQVESLRTAVTDSEEGAKAARRE
jgi:hypothetical protein